VSDDNFRREIRHVLFIHIVGHSKLLIEEQKERVCGQARAIDRVAVARRARTLRGVDPRFQKLCEEKPK